MKKLTLLFAAAFMVVIPAFTTPAPRAHAYGDDAMAIEDFCIEGWHTEYSLEWEQGGGGYEMWNKESVCRSSGVRVYEYSFHCLGPFGNVPRLCPDGEYPF